MRKIYLFGIFLLACFLPLQGLATQDYPSFEITPENALFMGYVEIGKSGSTSFEVTCIDYTGPAYATVGAPFSVSLDGVNFTDTVHFNSPGTTIYIRFTPINEGYVYSAFKLEAPGVMDKTAYASGHGITCNHSIPYSFNFNESQADCWSIVDANNDGTYFHIATTSYFAYYSYNSTNPADDWLISPDFQLDGNQIGHIDYRAGNSSYYERFQVFALGDDTIPLSPVIETNIIALQTLYFDLSSLNGTYRIGIHCISDANLYKLTISNFCIVNNNPQVILNPYSISFPATAPTSSSSAKIGTVTSLGTAGTLVTLSVPAPFELSSDGTTYSNQLSLMRGGGNIETDTFYIRLSPILYENDLVEGVLTASYAGVQDSIHLSGTVINCENNVPYTYSFNDNRNACWTVLNANNDNKTFQFSSGLSYVAYNYNSSLPADDWLISPLFEFDGNQYGYFKYTTSSNYNERFQVFALGADTIPLTPVVDTASDSWTKHLLDLTVLNGAYKIGIHCTSDPDMYYLRITDFNILPIVPSIAFSEDSLSFHAAPAGGNSEPLQFNFTTMGLHVPVVVTAPEHFEVSVDGTTFSPSLTLPATAEAMRLYTLQARFAPTVVGVFASPLTVSASGLSDTCILKGISRDCNETVTIPFEEGFDGDFNYCWAIIDQDSAGNCWQPDSHNEHSGDQCMVSRPTYIDYTAEYVLDNWIVSQPIQLTDSSLLSFYIKSTTNQPRFSVYISTTGPDIEDFNTELYYNSESTPANYTYIPFSIPLYEYTGQTVRIAFRHHNSTATMYLDDVTIATPQGHPMISTNKYLYSYGQVGLGDEKTDHVEVTGYGLSGNITATVQAPFSLSVDGTTFGQTVTLPSEGGLLYIRFTPVASTYSSKDITLSSPGTGNVQILVTGSGIECYNTIPYTHLFNLRNSCWEVLDNDWDDYHFMFQTSYPSYAYIYSPEPDDNDWLISPKLPLDGNQYGFFEYNCANNPGMFQVFAIGSDTVPVTGLIMANSEDYYSEHKTIRFDLTPFSGLHRIGIRAIQDNLHSAIYFYNFNVLNITPEVELQADTLLFGEIGTNTGYHPVRQTLLSTLGIDTPITLTVTGPYEVSLDGIDYGPSLTIPVRSAKVTYDTVFVRFNTPNGGGFNGVLAVTAGNLTDSAFLFSDVFECTNTIPYTYNFDNELNNKCWTVVNANDDNRTFSFNTSYGHAQYFYSSTSAADDWLISPLFQLTGNQFGSFDYHCHSPYYAERFEVFAIGHGDTVVLVPPTEISNLNYQTLNFDLSGLIGDYHIGIHCLSDSDQYVFYVTNFKIEDFIPTLTADPEQMDFGTLSEHGFSEMQQLVVNGSGVFAPITVTAPAGFEVSTDSITFSGSVTIPARDYGFTTDTFYVRFNPTTEGAYNSPLIVSSNNCADTVLLHGDAFFCETPHPLPLAEDFEDALSPCWLVIDHDGDSHSWYSTTVVQNATGHEGTNAYTSLAYTSYYQGIIQNNWLVTPMIVPTTNTVLAFYATGTEGIPQQCNVYVAAENSAESFIGTPSVFSRSIEGDWEEYAVSLANYAGDTVYLAFQHYGRDAGAITIDDLIITDNLDHPVVMTDVSSLSFGSVIVGENATMDMEITAFGLSGSMVATTTAPFSLSVDGTTFASYANIPTSGCPLYIRYSPTSEGDDNGTVTLYIPGGQTRTIAVGGNGFDCLNTIPYSYQFNDNHIICWNVENNNGDNTTFEFDTLGSRAFYSFSQQNAANDWLISPTFQFNGNQYGHFDYQCRLSFYPERFEVKAIGADTIDIIAPMEINNTTPQTLNLDLTGLTGQYAIGIHCISNADEYELYISDFNILNVTPSITVEQDSLEFTLVPLNGTSSSQAVVVSSIGVYTPITASVPLPFEISADNITFSNTVVLPANSNLLEYDTLYVRFSPTSLDPAQHTLSLTSGNAQATVTLTGTSRDCDAVLTLPIFESFEGPSNHCWNFLDQDGDGRYWYVNNTNLSHTGDQCALSVSFSSEIGALTPDNWLVSQPIQLPELPARLSFWIMETFGYFANDYYSVYISTTGNSTTDFTDVLTSGYASTTFEQHSISLREYAGQTVWVAFRHHNCSDNYQLLLDDIDIRLDTIPQAPMVATDSVFSITQMSAVCIGHTVFDGNATVTACGFVWGTSPNPTLADNVVYASPSLSTMIGMLNGLSEHATYYVRAFASNSIGTEYGEDIVFTTLCGPATNTSFTQSACESFTWNDSTYYESGNYTQQLTNMIGCDSIVTLHLTILHGTHNAVTETACDTFGWHGVNYTQSGTYTYEYTNASGCGSTDTLHLTILHSNQSEMQETACESFTWNGVTYAETGDYTQTFTNAAGCDSVVTLHLTLNHAETVEFSETACDTFVWNDSVYSETGDYVQHFETILGCDSTVTLHLAIHNSDSTEFAAAECESYVWNDTTYTQSGDYTQTFTNFHGCDSVVTLHLTIHHGDSTEFDAAECESYVWNDTTYTQSGDYVQHFLTVHGCDSAVTLHLTVYPAVSNEETVNWPDSCYLWNDEEYCSSGDYTQTLTTIHGCDSTVTLHLTITVGVEDFVIDNDLHVYPNPTNGLLNVSATAFTDVQLFDAYGKLVGRWHTNGEVTQIDLSPHATGIYFVKVLNQNQVVGIKKVLKQ